MVCRKSKKVKELQEYYKHQQTIQEWENLGIWDDSVTYNSWFHAVGSYLTLVMPTARFNGLFNFFSRESVTVNTSSKILSWGNNAKGHLIKHADALGLGEYTCIYTISGHVITMQPSGAGSIWIH